MKQVYLGETQFTRCSYPLWGNYMVTAIWETYGRYHLCHLELVTRLIQARLLDRISHRTWKMWNTWLPLSYLFLVTCSTWEWPSRSLEAIDLLLSFEVSPLSYHFYCLSSRKQHLRQIEGIFPSPLVQLSQYSGPFALHKFWERMELSLGYKVETVQFSSDVDDLGDVRTMPDGIFRANTPQKQKGGFETEWRWRTCETTIFISNVLNRITQFAVFYKWFLK